MFVCLFVCAGKELTREAGGVAKERSLLFLLRKEMSAASFEKSRLKLVGSLQGHSDTVYSVSFSPDGTKVASGSRDNTVKLWDVTSGECLQTLEGHSLYVNSVSFSPDGTKVASGSSDETVKLWDVTSGECLQTLEGHSDYVKSVSFSPDGTKVALGSWDDTIKIWVDPRHKEMKVMMLCLRRTNCRRRDRSGDPLPSEAGRKLYNPDILRKLWEFL